MTVSHWKNVEEEERPNKHSVRTFVTLCKPAPYRNSLTYLLTYLRRKKCGQQVSGTAASQNCNCNWGTCIAPPTRRRRAHHRVNPYLGARRQNETEMFSDHDEMSPSIAAVSAPSVACSMLAVQQQKRLCHQFVDVSAAWRGCHTIKTELDKCKSQWPMFQWKWQDRRMLSQ